MASIILSGASGAELWTRTVALTHHWSSNEEESESKEEYMGQHDREWDN